MLNTSFRIYTKVFLPIEDKHSNRENDLREKEIDFSVNKGKSPSKYWRALAKPTAVWEKKIELVPVQICRIQFHFNQLMKKDLPLQNLPGLKHLLWIEQAD